MEQSSSSIAAVATALAKAPIPRSRSSARSNHMIGRTLHGTFAMRRSQEGLRLQPCRLQQSIRQVASHDCSRPFIG
jgi:hypothetical protein